MKDIPLSEKNFKIISRHRNTSRGILNASNSAKKTDLNYTKTHGNASARKIIIKVDGKDYTIKQFESKFVWAVI